MIDIRPEHARTLACVVDEGTLDAAAARLTITPSAVSQRLRALEIAVGRPVLRRVRPAALTPSGEAVVRYARQLELLGIDLAHDLDPGQATGLPTITVVVNADSLHTWALAGLATAADRVQLTILREDQDHSLDLLRSGAATAAVTATAAAVPGCSSRRLGRMRYRPVCAPGFAQRWFADGVDARTLAVAPLVAYDRRDDLQDRYLRRFSRRRLDPPRHCVPATHEFGEAIRRGMGWGLLPELQLAGLDDLDPLRPSDHLDVSLHWQQWRLASTALDLVATVVTEAARSSLL